MASILWLVSSAVFIYIVFLALGAFKSRPAKTAAQAMTTARLPEPEIKFREQQGSFYIPGDNKQWRVSFGDGPGASVRGWPSKGGLYTLYSCSTVELDFLGLDRFKEAGRPQNSVSAQADEEAYCERLR